MSYVGLDVGASTLVMALFERHNPLNPGQIDVTTIPTSNNFTTDMRAIGAVLSRFDDKSPIEEIGVAVAGRLNSARQTLLYAGNLTGWVDKPVAAAFAGLAPAARLIKIGNDGEAQALYEALSNPYLYGKDFVMWSVGTGIGTGRVTWVRFGDRLVPVCLPMEGQHVGREGDIVSPNPEVCGCGQLNCTERLGGGDGAQQRFHKSAGQITPAEWELVARDQAEGLRIVLVNHLVDYIVVGGGVTERQPQLMSLVEAHLQKVAVKGVVPQFIPATCAKLDAAVTGLTLLRSGRG
jgi:fructokinase